MVNKADSRVSVVFTSYKESPTYNVSCSDMSLQRVAQNGKKGQYPLALVKPPSHCAITTLRYLCTVSIEFPVLQNLICPPLVSGCSRGSKIRTLNREFPVVQILIHSGLSLSDIWLLWWLINPYFE